MTKRKLAGTIVACLMLVLVRAAAAQQEQQQRQKSNLPDPAGAASTPAPAPAGGPQGSLRLVSAAQIEATAATDVKAALALVPALLLSDSGGPEGMATLSLRGSSSQQALVLLDGHRVADAQSSFFDLNDLPVPAERIERIEVLPAPASVLYGADALGGVVNIVTRPPDTKPGFALGYGYGVDAEQRIAGGVQYGMGPAGLRLDGQRHEGDGSRENADFTVNNFAAGLTLPPAPWGLDVRWSSLEREAGVPGPAALPSPTARRKDSRTATRADFTYLPGGGWDVKTGVFTQRHTLSFLDPDPPEVDPQLPAAPIDSRHENRSQGFEAQWDVDTGRGELYTFGGEWVTDRIKSSADGNHDADRWGVFAQDRWRMGDWWAVGAIRRDQHSVFGQQTTPSLSMGWDNGSWKLWAAWARGARTPNFDELYWREQFLRGNPNLKPETSESYEGGIEAGGAGGLARFTYFRRTVSNLIRWADTDGDAVVRPENVAGARIDGWEAEVVYRPTAGISLPVGYQRLQAEDAETGKRLDGSVRSLWRAALQSTSGSLTWSLEYLVTDRGDYLLRDGAWRYDVLNAALSWKQTMGSLPLQLSLRAENIQDRNYETVEGYPQRGRSWLAEVRIGL